MLVMKPTITVMWGGPLFLVTMLCVVTAIGMLRVQRPGAERRRERSDAERQNERKTRQPARAALEELQKLFADNKNPDLS